MLYGRLFLPRSTLEALYLRRLTPKSQLRISCVSDSRLPNGGTILAHLQYDAAKHNTEYIYSTDSALLGVRGLYNFGPEPPLVEQPFEQSQLLPLYDRMAAFLLAVKFTMACSISLAVFPLACDSPLSPRTLAFPIQ